MKDYCLELAAQKSGAAKYNIMREYLQAYVLRIMHDHGAFQTAAFVGGTALRFLYDLPRFSEDLDFSLHGKPHQPFADLMRTIKQELTAAGYQVDISYNDAKTVQSAFIKFEGLMYEAGISPMKTQKFSVKIDIDTNPPQGAVLMTRVVNKFFPIAFLSHDLPSLFSGKIGALLSRKYTKGRDFFDLAWYVSRFKTVSPNLTFLQNGLTQMQFKKDMPTEENWREYLAHVVEEADWKLVYQDVAPFLENPKDMEVFTKENVLTLIRGDG